MSTSLHEPFARSSMDVDDSSDYHSAGGRNSNKSSGGIVDALWGSTARKVITVLTFLVIAILLGVAIYALTREAKAPPPPPVPEHVSSSSTAAALSSSSSSTYQPPMPSSSSMLDAVSSSSSASPPPMPTSSPSPAQPSSSSSIAPPLASSTAAPYVPGETEMLRRLGREMDSSRDMTADPCNDWYRYACGGWVNSTQLTGNQTMNTKGFTEARDDNIKYIRQILYEDWPIITPMFQSCMDVDGITRAGLGPVRRLMDALSWNSTVIRTLPDFYYALGELRYGMRLTALVSAGQSSNTSNPRQPFLQVGWGGFTVTGNNAWMSYVGPNATTAMARLTEGISAMFQLVDGSGSKAASDYYAGKIVEFERSLINITSRAAIAQYYRNRVNGEPTLQEKIDAALAEEHALGADNGMYAFDEVYQLTPHMYMQSYFNGTMILDVLKANNTPAFAYLPDNASFPLVDALLSTTPLDVLLAYTRWRALNQSMPYLSYDLRSVHHSYFNEFAPVTSYDDNLAAPLPNNYAYCSNLVVNNLDDLFGRYFVSLRLQAEKAQVATNLITWIRQAFERNLPFITWMDEATRAVALDKANAVLELVGGPRDGNWADYSRVTILRDQFYHNWQQIQGMRSDDEWRQLTRPISRAKFTMNPSLVNAQYSSRANAMTFPAAILQEPFFDFDYPMAVNLGRIGMVMGHELLHGFDNNGRQFDKDGVRRQWWDDSVVAAFVNRTQCMIKQYDNITVQGSKVNGSTTLGENIADNGGLHMAWLALQWYKETLYANRTEVDPTPPSKNPLTTDQLFYWANAQTWCTKATNAAIANQIRTDVHSPGEARVWGPIVNQPGDSFAKAFNCPVGSRMNPPAEQKCDLY